MVNGLTETFLAASADMHRIHRKVVRIGATAAWISAAFLLVAGFMTANDAMIVQAIGPVLAAGFMTL